MTRVRRHGGISIVLAGLATTVPGIAATKQIPCELGRNGSAMTSTLAGSLGRAVAATKYEDLSPEVIARAKLTVLDNFATLAYTARQTRANPYITRASQRGGVGEALLMGTGLKVPVEDSAAGNAWLIHAAETDDSDFRASLRASPVVMGPALAMAGAQKVSGRDFLLGLSVGYTVLGRLGAPLGPMQPRGFMSSGVWGPAAAAAVSARMLNMDGVATANAIALASSAGGGSFQYFYDQTEDKRMVVARAARAGVEAAILACRSEIGAARIFEGQAGLYPVLGGSDGRGIDFSAITSGFSDLEGPLRLVPKFYAASASIIPTLDALAQTPKDRMIDAGSIDHIILRGGPNIARIYQSKLDSYQPPLTNIGAKTNFAFVVALYLIRGSADAFDFPPETLADSAINNLARKIRFELIAEGPPTLTIVPRQGQPLILQPVETDSRKTEPVMLEARLNKFNSLTRDTMNDRERAWLRQEIDRLETVPDMAVWLARVDRILQ
jgi:2-methylcitrate dehydratase PrpD